MSANDIDTFMDKIRIALTHLKAALSKEYAWPEIAAIRAWKSYPSTRVSRAVATTSRSSRLQIVWTTVGRHRMLLTALVCTALFAVLCSFWLLPLIKSKQAQLDLRPAQWAQLQNLININQEIVTGDYSPFTANRFDRNPLSARNSTVFPLHESELPKVRAVFEARDIRPGVLRLTTDNPPRLELQANAVLFSAWIEVLDELRYVWHLYPNTVTAVATTSPGLVNISSTLQQAPVEIKPQLP